VASDGERDGTSVPGEGSGDDVPSRRSLLRGIGAAVAGTGLSLEGGEALDWNGGAIDAGGGAARGSVLDRQAGVDPIPESYEIEVGGETHEVPINRKVVTGSCADMIEFVESGGVVAEAVRDQFQDDNPGGWTYGEFTINGDPVWPAGGEEVALRGLPDEFSGEAAPAPTLSYPVEDSLEFGRDGDTLYVSDHDLPFGADIEVNVLDWHPSHPISEECREYWCGLIREIVEHERVHARDNLEVAHDINQKIQGSVVELPQGFDNLPPDGLPSSPLEADIESGNVDAARGQIVDRVQTLLRYYVDEAVSRTERRTVDFHDTDAGQSDVTDTCHPYCRSCEEEDGEDAESVDAWRLEVSHHWTARVTDEQEDERFYHETRQSEELAFRLEREQRSLGPLLSFLNGIVSWLDGIDSFIGDLAEVVGLDVDLVPSSVGDRALPVYRGTGTASISRAEEMYREWENPNGPTNWERKRITGSANTPVEDEALLELEPEAETYQLDWPLPSVILQSLNWSFIDGELQGPATLDEGQPAAVNLARRQAGTRILPETEAESPDIEGQPNGEEGNRSLPADVGDVPDVESTNTMEIDYSFEECPSLMTEHIEQPLRVGTVGLAYRPALTPNGDGERVGRETLRWQIVPADFEEAEGPGHVLCSE